MPRQGRFSTLVGVATIVGAVFAGIAVKTELVFAVNTAVDTVKDQSRIALKKTEPGFSRLSETFFGGTIETASTRDGLTPIEAGDTAPPVPSVGERATTPVVKVTRSVSRKPKRQRTVRVAKRKAKRKTVSIFAAAKDIPMPTRD